MKAFGRNPSVEPQSSRVCCTDASMFVLIFVKACFRKDSGLVAFIFINFKHSKEVCHQDGLAAGIDGS